MNIQALDVIAKYEYLRSQNMNT